MHAERLYTMLPQNLLLSFVDVPQANVHQFLQAQSLLFPQPPKHICFLFPCQSRQESNGHTMNVAASTRLGCINVRMRVHPNHRHFPAESFLDGSRGAYNRTNSDGVIAS